MYYYVYNYVRLLPFAVAQVRLEFFPGSFITLRCTALIRSLRIMIPAPLLELAWENRFRKLQLFCEKNIYPVLHTTF